MNTRAFVTFLSLVTIGGIQESLLGGYPTDGLQAYYPFEDAATDLSGKGNDLSAVGPIDYGRGVLGRALLVTTDAYLEGPTEDLIYGSVNPDELTVCLWVRPDEFSTDLAVVSTYESAGWDDNFPIAISFEAGVLVAGGRAAAPAHVDWRVDLTTTGQVQSGTWYHVAVVFNKTDGVAQGFLNGEFKGSAALRTDLDYTDGGLFRINASRFLGQINSDLVGAIDEVLVYSRALSALEIEAIYSEPPVAHYEFEGDLKDSSVNALDGVASDSSFAYVGAVMDLGVDLPGTPTTPDFNIEIPPYPFDLSSITVSGWIRVESNDDLKNQDGRILDAPLVVYQTGDFLGGFTLRLIPEVADETNTKLFALAQNAEGAAGEPKSGAIVNPFGRWIHVASVLDRVAGTHALYVDGLPVDTRSADPRSMTVDRAFIGGYRFSSARNGLTQFISPGAKLDDIRLYRRALGDEEIKDLFLLGEAGLINDARPVNLSVRAQVGTGGNILIPGLVIEGSGSREVLIRAVGPSLTRLGVSDALSNPKLTLIRDGQEIAMNDNWGDAPNLSELTGLSKEVGAFDLDPGSSDAVALTRVYAGAYTVKVEGVGGATGVCLVEVYFVD